VLPLFRARLQHIREERTFQFAMLKRVVRSADHAEEQTTLLEALVNAAERESGLKFTVSYVLASVRVHDHEKCRRTHASSSQVCPQRRQCARPPLALLFPFLCAVNCSCLLSRALFLCPFLVPPG
jgi:hypothetical protein